MVRPPADSSVIATQTVKFTCVAYGNPIPSVEWIAYSGKNLTAMAADESSPVTITDSLVTTGGVTMLVSVLEICSVDASFADTYACSASNGVPGDGIVPAAASFALKVTQPITGERVAVVFINNIHRFLFGDVFRSVLVFRCDS